ncbi:MAG: beta-lactamase family protein [Solirubrobacterales bacterium]|nr:beta-lactamase family protein [Solirubrobacterales bacterium]
MTARLRTLLALAAALAALGAAGPVAHAATSRAAVHEAFQRIVSDPEGPPGIVAIVQRGARAEVYRLGVADVASGRRPAVRDHIRIASVSKAFNGAVALSLASDRTLPLGTTIVAGLPGTLPRAGGVTVRQALQHVGGLPEYIRSEGFVRALTADPTGYLAPRQLLGFVRDEPLDFPPGSRYRYSDTDNIVVGLMAARAAGRPYRRLLRDRVFRPLGLTATSLPAQPPLPAPRLRGYEVAAGEPPEDVTTALSPSGAWASGGIVSTPRDLSRFIRAYAGGRLFGTAARRAQLRFRPGASSPPGPGANAAGLGIFRYRTSCGTVLGHTGSFPGYRIFAAATRDGRRSVVFAANAQIVPGQGSEQVSDAIRAAQRLAVCRALGR